MAGYSPKSLAGKLGWKEGRKALFLFPPDGYAGTLGRPLPVKATSIGKTITRKGPFDFIQAFVRSEEELERLFPQLKALLTPDGMAWISWPKQGKTKPLPGALNENRIRAIGLESGLVDVKVCAVDETWSGLKFVFRLADRARNTP